MVARALLRSVAQLGSAPDWGSGGRRFNSCHSDVSSDNVGGRGLGTVTISVDEYKALKADSAKLVRLENAGVDNWEGYDVAMEDMDDDD